jgi:hypothetical protein
MSCHSHQWMVGHFRTTNLLTGSMKILFILLAIVFTGVNPVCGQQQSNNEEVKYVIFTSSNENSEIKECMYKYTSKTKSDTHMSPTIPLFGVASRCVVSSRPPAIHLLDFQFNVSNSTFKAETKLA